MNKKAFSLLLILVGTLSFSLKAQDVIVQIEAGKVQGQINKGMSVFKSIPYAAPPVGTLRFAAPVKPMPWDGVRKALDFGPSSPTTYQTKKEGIDEMPIYGSGWIKGDDYLTANVWTPDVNAKRLPVMLYIYGGAFVFGSSNVPLFDGTNFAKKGVIMVSFNYRLGIEGFLKIKGVPTNIGIRDQIAAMQWVHDNIAAFGGDPDNVTIFGESAGAISVAALLVSPAAKGLFKRAIMQSGSGQAVFSGEQADRIAKQYSKTLKIENTREAYLKLTTEELVALQPKVTPRMVGLETDEYADPSGGVATFFPIIDGDIIPDMPLRILQKSTAGNYDLMLGYNTDEMNTFLIPTGLLKKIKLEIVLKIAVKKVHPAPAALITIFRKTYPSKNRGELFSAILTSYQAQVPAIRYANAHAKLGVKTFMYEFAWQSSYQNGAYGAYHGLEMPFVFNNLEGLTGDRGMLGPNGAPQSLADKMQDAWVEFAKTGSPGWDAYTTSERKTMLINTNWQLQTNPHAKILTAWDGVREQ